MKFIDEVTIEVQAGKGGAGSRHFRREKFVPLGGPDGGNGGRGGSVILRADKGKNTLLDFTFRSNWKAEDGQAGGGSCKDGKAAVDLVIPVPIGTQITDVKTGKLVADLVEDQQQLVLAQGGRGGKGNAFFKSATNQAPDHAQPGEEGQGGSYLLSLKLLADVGLVGFPNAGKSTLISRISAARPKIADYPFTTLEPNLGVVQSKGGYTFVVADIPGLIPGAHLGKGLGTRFLKHIERTKLVVHLIDPHQVDAQGKTMSLNDSFQQINEELRLFSDELSKREQIIAITKLDSVSDSSELEPEINLLKQRGLECHLISSVSGAGIEALVELLASKLRSWDESSAYGTSVPK